jgi:hypothetical protein
MVLPVVLVELLARIEMRSAALAVEFVCVRHVTYGWGERQMPQPAATTSSW